MTPLTKALLAHARIDPNGHDTTKAQGEEAKDSILRVSDGLLDENRDQRKAEVKDSLERFHEIWHGTNLLDAVAIEWYKDMDQSSGWQHRYPLTNIQFETSSLEMAMTAVGRSSSELIAFAASLERGTPEVVRYAVCVRQVVAAALLMSTHTMEA